MNEIKISLKKLLEVYKSKDSKKIFIATKDLIIFILVLCFLKIPFIFFRDMVVDYFNKMNMENILSSLFYWLFEVLYLLFVILILKKWLIKKYGTKAKD